MSRLLARVSVCACLLLLCAGRAWATPYMLDEAPAYNWYHGCGPTAAGSIIGYWDIHGLSNLFTASGSNLYLTSAVQDQISSPEHNAKYDPTPDDPNLPTPAKTSIADWFCTSQYPDQYGWSYSSYAPAAFTGYATYRGYTFQASNLYVGSSFTFDTLTAQINLGRPVMFLVDSDGDGATDHFVPVYGYDDRGTGGQWYACYTTWGESETLAWYQFRPMSSSYSWGVYDATTVTPPFQFKTGSGTWSSGSSWSSGPPTSSTNDSAWLDSDSIANLNGGTVSINRLNIGFFLRGTLNQSGGASMTAAEVHIGEGSKARGEYNISSGSLTTGVLWLARSGTAALNITGPNVGIRANEIHFGTNSVFTALAPVNLWMTGTVFENRAPNPLNMAGLANVRLIAANPGLTLDYEVAGQDLGATLAGFANNFALGELVMTSTSGAVRLVSAFDNTPGWSGTEALYVQNLTLDPAAKFSPGSYHVYFLANGTPAMLRPGDADADGVVGGSDYAIWLNHFGLSAQSWPQGDYSGDGVIGGDDYAAWLNNFGMGPGGGAAQAPEPRTLAMVCLGAGLLRRKKTVARWQ